MRITRETLLKIARDTVTQRTRSDSSIISAYLCGSLLGDDYLLGGAADIDLALIHIDDPVRPREIVALTEDVHLDIAHYGQGDFRNPRQLRLHPWMGPTLFGCKPMYDPQHFLDFTLASVRGQFDRPDYILKRSRQQAEHARQIWLSFITEPERQPGTHALQKYLRAVDHAANAVSCLSGMPLAERRLLLEFGRRAQDAGQPGLLPGLVGLLGGAKFRVDDGPDLLSGWAETWDSAASAQETARLHPARRAYYLKSFQAALESSQPQALLWPLLRTWTQAADSLPEDSPGRKVWQRAVERLALSGSDFDERVQAMDHYLDLVEETLENWAASHGA